MYPIFRSIINDTILHLNLRHLNNLVKNGWLLFLAVQDIFNSVENIFSYLKDKLWFRRVSKRAS